MKYLIICLFLLSCKSYNYSLYINTYDKTTKLPIEGVMIGNYISYKKTDSLVFSPIVATNRQGFAKVIVHYKRKPKFREPLWFSYILVKESYKNVYIDQSSKATRISANERILDTLYLEYKK